MRAIILLLLIALTLAGCTAQQWETTKAVLSIPVVLAVAVLVSAPPPVTTRCETIARHDRTETVCTTY